MKSIGFGLNSVEAPTPYWKSSLLAQDSLFKTIRDSYNDLPHIFITGPPACGKTTFLEEVMKMFKTDPECPFKVESVLLLSSEKDRGIHTIRDKVNDFCKRTVSKPNHLRWIVIDDADTLPLISQQALRRPMETFSHLTRFLFASRHSGNLIEPLRSRCLTLEIEPINSLDAYPLLLESLTIPPIHRIPALQDFCLKNYTNLKEIKSILNLYNAYIKEGFNSKESISKLKDLLPRSVEYTSELLESLAKKDEVKIRDSITNLYLHGYLLDDILLAIEKHISIFPSTDPDIRFAILHFTIVGWISIQQGKEHWLDTMDIVDHVSR